jgi:serine/alanine adding enzyme
MLKNKSYCIKIDPFFCINETSFKENREIPLNFKLDYDKKHQNLIHSGYIHKGFKKDLSSYLQPRYHMAVPLIDKNNNFLDSDTIRTSISRTTRNYIGNYHQKRGVYFTYSSNISNLDNFYDIINMTEQRQHITLRNKDYFKKILTSFKERALLCFAHVDLDKYMSFLDSEIKANNKNNDLKRQYEEANELHQKYGTDVITSVALVLMPSNKGVRMMEYLYAGNNTSILSHLNTNVGLLFDIFKKCLEKNIHYCNLGGVEGTLDDNLTTFKSKFNPVILEFAGEYDLPINKGTYKVINGLIPYAKKTYKKIRSLIRKVK